jgi:tetratricopeptide (TPR) repeat protein
LLAHVADPDAEDRAPALAAVTQLLDDGVLNQHDDYFYPGCTFLDYMAWEKLKVARPTAADHHAVDRALVAWSGALLDAGYAWTVDQHIALNQLLAAAERKRQPSPLSVRLSLRAAQLCEMTKHYTEGVWFFGDAAEFCEATREHALRAYALARLAACMEAVGEWGFTERRDQARRSARSKLAKSLLTPTLREPCHVPAHTLSVLGGVPAHGGPGEQARLASLLDAAAEAGQPSAARADALHALAWRRGLAGSRDAMLSLLHQAVEVSCEAHGASSVPTATRRSTLGALLIEAGQRAEGRAQLEQALAVFAQAEGGAPTEYTLTLNTLAGLARAGGGYAEAAQYLERAVALCERFPVAPAVALITRHNQASLALATAMRLPPGQPVRMAPSEGARGRGAASD